MAKAQSKRSENNDNTLKNNEGGLLANQLSVVAVLELGNTVGTTGENQEAGSGETGKESLISPSEARGSVDAQVADHVVGKGADEGSQDNDLQSQTGHGHVDAQVGGGAALAGVGGHGTAGGLEDEANDVKGDEDVVEQLGLESRQAGSEVDDGLGEGNVDGSAEEDGGDGEADCKVG